MLAVKHKKEIQYLVEEAKADISIQAEEVCLCQKPSLIELTCMCNSMHYGMLVSLPVKIKK